MWETYGRCHIGHKRGAHVSYPCALITLTLVYMTRANEAVTARVVGELERLRWSRADLARALGHERAWVTRKLNGSRRWSVDDLDAVARALMLSPCELLLETVCGQLEAPALLEAAPALGLGCSA